MIFNSGEGLAQHLALIEFTPDCLALFFEVGRKFEVLEHGIPAESVCQRVFYDERRDVFVMVLEHEDFSQIRPGEEIPRLPNGKVRRMRTAQPTFCFLATPTSGPRASWLRAWPCGANGRAGTRPMESWERSHHRRCASYSYGQMNSPGPWTPSAARSAG